MSLLLVSFAASPGVTRASSGSSWRRTRFQLPGRWNRIPRHRPITGRDSPDGLSLRALPAYLLRIQAPDGIQLRRLVFPRQGTHRERTPGPAPTTRPSSGDPPRHALALVESTRLPATISRGRRWGE